MIELKRLFFLLLVALMTAGSAWSQSAWSLQKCVAVAKENSIAVKQNKLGIERADIAAIRALHNRYPNLSSTINYGLNFGRTIDPTTNLFDNQTISNNRVGLSSNLTIYNGGAIKNTTIQSKIDLQAAQLDADQYTEDLSLSVVQYYLAILFAQDRLDNARIQVQSTTEQLNQVDKLIAAGSKPEGDRLDILAQQAKEEQNIITTENTVTSNKLSLKQLLRLPLDQPFDIEKPAPNALQPSIQDQDILAVYNYAMQNRSDIKSGELKVQSAELGVKINKSAYLPSLFLGGNLNTYYSNAARKISGFKNFTNTVPITFSSPQLGSVNPALSTITGNISQTNEVPVFGKNPYFSQIDQNLGLGVGLGLNIPIYQNYRNKANVRLAEVAVETAKLNKEQTKETLKNNIQTALNEMRATANTYEAAKRTTAAQRLAYNNVNTKFNLGSANTFELLTAKNKLDIAITEELISRYDYIFRSKVIDYYLGRSITLN